MGSAAARCRAGGSSSAKRVRRVDARDAGGFYQSRDALSPDPDPVLESQLDVILGVPMCPGCRGPQTRSRLVLCDGLDLASRRACGRAIGVISGRDRRTDGRSAQGVMVTGVPGPMRVASQVMACVSRRMHPWDTAVPRMPPMLFVPCSAICPGPPSNCCSTFERALSASAYGAPTASGSSFTVSSTKKRPSGVGVDGLPTTAVKVRAGRPSQ